CFHNDSRRFCILYSNRCLKHRVVFPQRAFDQEHLRAFELKLQARDRGSPALSPNVSLRVLLGNRNDNAPRVLYPALRPDCWALFNTLRRAAQPGYLVTKGMAVEADLGHNACLTVLPRVAGQRAHPGAVHKRELWATGTRPACNRLLISVRNGGQPPLASATLFLVFADGLQEALPDLSDHYAKLHTESKINFYLVIALALVIFILPDCIICASFQVPEIQK
ncbi:protocadherin gamma-B7-like, partial [Loxodonta africana]|uniref:protocadherin gamma-B7-like n=1 Tax=Loxodonta africana TaxID=9785 RepID=UPI0030CFB40B